MRGDFSLYKNGLSRKNQKKLAIILSAVMLITIIAACSTDDPAPAEGTGAEEATTEETPIPAERDLVTITMPTYRSGQDVGAVFFLPQVERFNARYEGIFRVEIEESPSDVHNDMLKGLARAGALPPLFQFSDFPFARENWFNDNVLYNLAPWFAANPDVKNVFVPSGMEFVTQPDGAIYAVPLAVVRPTGTYINTDVFSPERPLSEMSWSELGAALAAADAPWGLDSEWIPNLTTVSIMGGLPGGVELLQSGLEDPIRDFNSSIWIETFTIFQDFFLEAGWAYGVTATYPDTENAFVNSQIGIMANGQWIISVFDADNADAWGPGFNGESVRGDIFPGNVAIANPNVYDWYVSAHASDEEREAALAFLAFISSPEELEAFMLAEGGSAPMIDVSQSFLDQAAANRLMSDFSGAVNADTTYVPFLHEVLAGSALSAFFAYLPMLLDGSMTPTDFAASLTVAATE